MNFKNAVRYNLEVYIKNYLYFFATISGLMILIIALGYFLTGGSNNSGEISGGMPIVALMGCVMSALILSSNFSFLGSFGFSRRTTLYSTVSSQLMVSGALAVIVELSSFVIKALGWDKVFVVNHVIEDTYFSTVNNVLIVGFGKWLFITTIIFFCMQLGNAFSGIFYRVRKLYTIIILLSFWMFGMPFIAIPAYILHSKFPAFFVQLQRIAIWLAGKQSEIPNPIIPVCTLFVMSLLIILFVRFITYKMDYKEAQSA